MTVNKFYSATDWGIVQSMGYDNAEDIKEILDIECPVPHPTAAERVRWFEFLRALKEDDFSIGDRIALFGFIFEVVQ